MRQVLLWTDDLKSFSADARWIFRKEYSKLYCYFYDSMKQIPGNKYVCFHISQFLLPLTKQGNGAQREFSPRFSSDFENKQKVLLKGILTMHFFPLEIRDWWRRFSTDKLLQTLKSEANISPKFSQILIKKSELISERIREFSESLHSGKDAPVFKSSSICCCCCCC